MRSTAIRFTMLLLLLTQVGCVGKEFWVSSRLVELFDPGLAVFHSRKMEQQITDEQPSVVKTNVYISSDHTVIWVPLIHVFCDHGPYTTSVYVKDCSGENESIEINEVVMEYKNGKVFREKVLWTGGLPEVTSKDDSVEPPEEAGTIEFHQSLHGFPDKFASGKVTVRGCLIKPSGERVEFESTQSIHAKMKFEIWPYWLVLSGV